MEQTLPEFPSGFREREYSVNVKLPQWFNRILTFITLKLSGIQKDMKNAHILVVEDEQDIRDLISFQMKSEGHQVTAVDSADKAVTILERGDKIDLFIIDWMLPGSMNGLEFTKKLRSHKSFKNSPVIMIAEKAALLCMI